MTAVCSGMDSPFDLEDVVIEAWKQYPESFGMRKYDFPDVNRVKATICGSRGLVGTGILRQVGENRYVFVGEKARDDGQYELARATSSKAYKKWIFRYGDTITFSEAMELWQREPHEWIKKIQCASSVADSYKYSELLKLHLFLKEKFRRHIKLKGIIT